jgi:1-acyl-sn-glycerol-3-phosphate acyltransferase
MSVVIFPQTTRSIEFDPRKFNSLGIKLAKRAGAPVIPFALKTDAWGIGRWLKDFGCIRPQKTVRICFGQLMTINGPGKREHQLVVDFIAAKLAGWENEN